MSDRIRTIIMGAAGRDFHNFNVHFRGDARYEVVAFTATQIPGIAGRRYIAELAGELYPQGIPIYDEADLLRLVREHSVQQVVFSYSDVSHDYVMQRASAVLAAGADFRLMGTAATQLKSSKPVVAVCAVRTGAGKSPTARATTLALQKLGYHVVVVRHPMPYGNLMMQRVQRFGEYDDLDEYECTIEEREEYEPHLANGVPVYAGTDYEKVLRAAEQEADVIVWDGGNNDVTFFAPDYQIVVTDPHRPGHELQYYPGEVNLLLADVVVINKVVTAPPEGIVTVRNNVQVYNPGAVIVEAASPIEAEDPAAIQGKRVLAVEDGPTLTHGEMTYGAAALAAKRFGAAELVDPRPYAAGSIVETFARYPTTGEVLPAMGYSDAQRRELAQTINNTPCDLVLIGTPIDLRRIVDIQHPSQRVTYELREVGQPTLYDLLEARFGRATG